MRFCLQCTVEAFPFAVNYWERHDGRLIQQRPEKYRLSSNDFDGYKTDLYLNISLNHPADFGTYYCISKNEKGLTKAAIELFGKIPFIYPTTQSFKATLEVMHVQFKSHLFN